MTELSFVNIFGDTVDTKLRIAKPKKQVGAKRVLDLAQAKEHHGFEMVGVSLRDVELARDYASYANKDFSQQAYLNGAKPKRAIKRVFFVPDAASVAMEILSKQGTWLALHVRPILKG